MPQPSVRSSSTDVDLQDDRPGGGPVDYLKMALHLSRAGDRCRTGPLPSGPERGTGTEARY
jgi:hypothetical protein